MPVTSVLQEFDVRVACIVKSAARDSDKLLPVLMEDGLVAKSPPPTTVKVHENVVSDAMAARVMVNAAMASESWCQGEALPDMSFCPKKKTGDRPHFRKHDFWKRFSIACRRLTECAP